MLLAATACDGGDLLGLAWCGRAAVCILMTRVVGFTDVDHTAPHSRYKVAVMLFTLTVRLEDAGREEQIGFWLVSSAAIL